MKKFIVSLVGPIGSGTTSARNILQNFGFFGYSYGSQVAEYISYDVSRGKIKRDNLQFWGYRALEVERDFNHWDKRIVERVKASDSLNGDSRGIVLDSLKYPFQVSFWREFARKRGYDFFLIGINAPKDLRCDRIVRRARNGDCKNSEEFEIADQRDLDGYRRNIGQDTLNCMRRCKFDFRVNNDLSEQAFESSLIDYFKNAGVIS